MRNSLPVPLAPKVFDTLVVLVQHSGHLLKKDELMQEVWPDRIWSRFRVTGRVSEVVNGKRAISKTQAKALGELFKVSPELFI